MSRYFAIVISTLLVFNVKAIDVNQKFDYIKALVETTVNELNIPGYSVGIVFNGTERKISVGLRNISDPESKITEDTLFAIASCTKAFTTYALHSIIQEKNSNLRWASKVRDVIPEFRIADEFTTSKILVQDLVSHISGLPRHDGIWGYSNSLFNETDLLDKIASLELHNDLREKFEYTNNMYAVAGIVMKRLTGLSWHDNIKTRIFTPFNMSRSFTLLRLAQAGNEENMALPHTNSIGFRNALIISNDSLYSVENTSPSGSILSSLNDMLKWVRVHLRENDPFIKFLHHSRVTMDDSKSYGLGWLIDFKDGHRNVWHNGGLNGFRSLVSLWPEMQLGICILSNWDLTANINQALADRIRNVMVNDSGLPSKSEDEAWVLQLKSNADKNILKEKTLEKNIDNELRINYTLDDPDQFVGHYDNLGYGSIEITFNSSTNLLYAIFGRARFELRKTKLGSSDRFFAVHSFPINDRFECVFIRDFRTNMVSDLDWNFEPTTSMIRFQKRTHEKFLKHEYLSSFVGKYNESINNQSLSIKYDNETSSLTATLNDGTFFGRLRPTYERNRFNLVDNSNSNKASFAKFNEDKLYFTLYTGNEVLVWYRIK